MGDLGEYYRAVQQLETMGLFKPNMYLLKLTPDPDGTYRAYRAHKAEEPVAEEISITRPMPRRDVVALGPVRLHVSINLRGGKTEQYAEGQSTNSDPIGLLQLLAGSEWKIVLEDELKNLKLKTEVHDERKELSSHGRGQSVD